MPTLDLSFESGEPSLAVHRFTVEEEVSSPFTVSVWARTEDPSVDLSAIVGRPATFRIGSLADGGARAWPGVVSLAEQQEAAPSGLSTYFVRIVPTLWLLGKRRNHRIYQHLSIPGVVGRVLADHGIVPVWDVVEENHPLLEYKVQYGESDHAFVSRLLEESGIAVTFPDRGDGARLTLTDAPQGGAPRAGGLPYRDRPSTTGSDYVTRVQLAHEVRPGAVAVRDHDFENPSFDLLAASLPAAPGPEARLEQFHYRPGAFITEPVRGGAAHHHNFGRELAERWLAADRTGRRGIGFETNVLDLGPGAVFTVDGHPHPDLEATRRLLATARVIAGTLHGAWSIAGRAVFADEPFRPPRRTPKPRVPGVQTAEVVGPAGQEIYTDGHGRVRVQFPWDREGNRDQEATCWIRASQGWSGPGFGNAALPRVGQEVLVAFADGDPDQPIVVGRVFNQRNPVPYTLPTDKTVSGWKSDSSAGSAGYNEIKLEDKKGDELVNTRAERNQRQLVKHDQTITIGHDSSATSGDNTIETTLHDRTQVTGGDRSETTQANRVTFVGGDSLGLVKGDRSERILATELAFVGKDQHLVVVKAKKEKLESDDELHIEGANDQKVGGTDSLAASSLQIQVGGDAAIATGIQGKGHIKAGKPLVAEGASSVTAKGPGGFICIDAGGVTISGTLVMINEGGSAGDGDGAGPAAPEAPREAKGVAAPHAPAPGIVILDDAGHVITRPQTKVVGQKVTLSVRSEPAGTALTGVSWVIPAENVKTYTQSAATAVRTDLAAADLAGASLTFYWISGGTKTVEVSAMLGGAPVRATATYHVHAPTHVTMTSTTGAVTVDAGFNFPGMYLHYGNPLTTPAIAWTLKAKAPAGGAGEIAGTQLLNMNVTQTLTAGATVQHLSTAGVWFLDTSAPYVASVAVAAGAAATWSSSDSPGIPLDGTLDAVSIVRWDFRTFFMYKPAGADSIWVTLARLDWHWVGATTRTGLPAANTWTAPTGVATDHNPSGVASTELPTWPDNFTSLRWV